MASTHKRVCRENNKENNVQNNTVLWFWNKAGKYCPANV